MSHGPNDQATQWLLDKMHDPHVSLRHRIECAKTLLEIHPEEFRIRWVRDPRDESVVTLKSLTVGSLLSSIRQGSRLLITSIIRD